MLKAAPTESGAFTSDALPKDVLLIGTYVVESVLGQGGFGITYRCHDRMLDRPVAVKEFFPSGCRREQNLVEPSRGLTEANYREARAQFLAEARLLARCHHVGIVGVHAAFEANETAYMVMELLHGKSLGQLLTERGGRLNEAEAIGIIERVGEALEFVHSLDLLHRDIKPDNIMVCDDGRVMLIDFGTARETIQDQVQGHTVVVTPGYAPLEQYARQAKRGAFTDVYSLAATLYHLLTGQMPPAASDRAMGVQLRPLREFNSPLNPSVSHAVERALQMEIARRPQSVREFLDLLHAPITEAESKSYFAPSREELATPENDEAGETLPPMLTPDAIRARQLSWQNAMPAVRAQPVQLAPPRAFSGAVSPPIASTPASLVSANASGNVGVQGAHGVNNSLKSLWVAIAAFVGFVGFLVMPSLFGGTERRVSSSPEVGGYHQSRPPSNPNFSPPFTPKSLSDDFPTKARAAQKEWSALMALAPSSVETLPDSREGQEKGSWWLGVAFSPDGKRLATIDGQNVLRVMSLPDRKVVRSLKLDPKLKWGGAMFSPDNQTIAATGITKSGDLPSQSESVNRVSAWNVRTGRKLGTFAINENERMVLLHGVLNGGELLLQTIPLQQIPLVFVWNPKTGKRSKIPFDIPSTSLWAYGAASPDGKEIVYSDESGRLRWMDMQTGKQKAEQTTPWTWGQYKRQFGKEEGGNINTPLWVRDIEYSPNGSYVASRNEAEISLFDSKARKLGSLTFGSNNRTRFAISSDGKWVAAQGALPYGPTGNLLWNVKTGQKIRLQSPSQNLLDFGFSPDGKQLYGIFGEQTGLRIVTWRTDAKPTAFANFELTSESSIPSAQFGMANSAMDQAGERIAVASAIATDSGINIYNRSGTKMTRLISGGDGVSALGLSGNAKFLAFRAWNQEIQLWDVESQKLIMKEKANDGGNQNTSQNQGFQEKTRDMAFSSDSSLFATVRAAGNSQTIDLWSLKGTPRRLASFVQKEPVSALAFSPDNKGLICAGDKGLLQWYDVSTRQMKDQLRMRDSIMGIAMAARNLVVMGDATTTLFKVPTNSKRPLSTASRKTLPDDLVNSRDSSTAEAISGDGKLLVANQGYLNILVCDLSTGQLIQSLPMFRDGETFIIHGLALSADGTQLTTISQKMGQNNMDIPVLTVTSYRRRKAR